MTKNYLSVSELKLVEVYILKQVQANEFSEELKLLEANKELKSRSKLRCLHPFLNNGLILVGDRLENSNLAAGRKHPIVLPANHQVTRLIFEQNTKNNCIVGLKLC